LSPCLFDITGAVQVIERAKAFWIKLAPL
jgi:hypothetical protein